jgi:phage repressor protein C with HTH and peptisase S24 domain
LQPDPTARRTYPLREDRRVRWPFVRVLVAGPSMAPTLRAGDAVVVRRGARVRSGDVVLGRFRAAPELLVVKRAVRPHDGGWWVEGDNPYGTGDSRRYGAADVEGRVVWRYWPLWRRRPEPASSSSA